MSFQTSIFTKVRANTDTALAEMMLHIARRCVDDPRFGKTKLHKILLFSEIQSFIETGEPIVGCTFIKKPQGPLVRMLAKVAEDIW